MINDLTYSEQRELGAQLFPEIAEFILDETNCYKAIFDKIWTKEPLRERFLNAEALPLQWRYYWAKNYGNTGAMFFKSPPFSDNAYWEVLWLDNIAWVNSRTLETPPLKKCSCPHCQGH